MGQPVLARARKGVIVDGLASVDCGAIIDELARVGIMMYVVSKDNNTNIVTLDE
jgi:hypothetical protein